MKVTLNWLKQYVDFNGTPEELAERLTMLGLEVESVTKVAGEFDGVFVAEVLTREKVPGSDKLSVCRVKEGKGERQIICGANNFKPGDKVPLILPNFALPLKAGEKEPFVIKIRKVFGIESQGMMCSPQELGLADEIDGLLILRENALVGQPFAEYLGRQSGDVLYDLEVTPNRPDLNSVIGIAREIAAVTGQPLRLPEITLPAAAGEAIDKLVAVRLDDSLLCPRYTARVIRGVRVGPSPDWLRAAVEKLGIRSINNVVDVTNFVLMEAGQPLHAFDYHLVTKGVSGIPTIVVRKAKEGEKFTTLDGQERTLTPDMLLIADESRGIALAGIMGGQNTEISGQTKDVLIESACFQPSNIRRTSKALGLRSESSYRFERGADIGIAEWASRRCAQLILQTAGGQLAEGVVDVYPNPQPPKEITLRHQKVNALLGISLRPEEIEFYLGQLGLKQANRKARPLGDDAPPEPATFRIPSYRVDLKGEVDLIEEVCRLHGVDRIPSTPPRGAIGSHAFDAVYDQINEARRILAGLGISEAQGQTLIAHAAAELSGTDKTALVVMENPLSAEMDVLRPSLLPGLLDALRHNIHHKNHDLALFEIGRVFQRISAQEKEERRVAIALTGTRDAAFWRGENRGAKFDIYDLKGAIEDFLEYFGLRGVVYAKRNGSSPLFLESATVTLGGKLPLGEFGQLLPALAKQHDLRDAVFLAEFNLDMLLSRRNPTKNFKSLPQFPSVRRDIAMVLPEAVTHDAVLVAVKQSKAAQLESAELFDVFRGKNLPEQHKSVAYAFTYRGTDKTLTDAEVNAAHEKLVAHLKTSLGAVIRE
jgi:phenylalanyl-tRNA synthetase beta chain